MIFICPKSQKFYNKIYDKVLILRVDVGKFKQKKMRTNNLHLLVVSWLVKYWMHCMTRFESLPTPLSSPDYSLFHPPCSHPQRLDVCRQVEACAQGNVDMLLLTLDTRFVVVFFVLIHISQEETVNVKSNSMRVCVCIATKSEIFKPHNDWINRCYFHMDAARRMKCHALWLLNAIHAARIKWFVNAFTLDRKLCFKCKINKPNFGKIHKMGWWTIFEQAYFESFWLKRN